ncbi:enoyl-CoA hydratase/isomerase family protein [Rhodanobacter sp. Col0626]|uniref:enoyl-CoA hydratase/isomerase family protein n=1 Tax=Rhodanobacter sp. Col0626 TaxID=3415679 RepID=UPI003CEAE250
MAELVVHRSEGMLEITLARPEKMNALSATMVESLHEELDRAEGDGTRLLVLRGEGRNFSAGFDFGGYEEQSEGDLLRRFVRIEQLLQRVHHASYDTMAFVRGRNFGAGVDLFAACNRRVCTSHATFRMPGLSFGLVLGTRRFAALAGSGWAREVLHDGITFDAEQAHGHGFVTLLADDTRWAELSAAALQAACTLSGDAAERLFRVTRADTRDADMAELVASAARPGLLQRLRDYRQALGK